MIEDRIFSVYIHKFPNGKQYVGITSTKPEKRWCSGNGYKQNKGMYEDVKKYGWSNIEHILFNDEGILYTEEEASYIEQCLIDSWDLTNPEKGYNLRTGGTASYTLQKETKKKISKSIKEKKLNCKPIIKYSFNGKIIEEYSSITEASNKNNINARNISNCCRGKRKSTGGYQWFYKSDNFKSVKPQIPQKKPIIKYSLDENKLAEYCSLTEASQLFDIDTSAISACCRGKRKTAGGYIWKYKE